MYALQSVNLMFSECRSRTVTETHVDDILLLNALIE